MSKLGLIAGAGGLPVEIARACEATGRPIFIIRLGGLTEPGLATIPGIDAGVAEWGKVFSALRREGCTSVCFAGRVPRPNFANLKPDLRGLAALPGVAAAARKGDDALLRQILHEIEKEGFAVEGVDVVLGGLTVGEGPLGRHVPGSEHLADIEKAMATAKAIGILDIGQATVVVDGVVIAVEAQEGTDAMLRRCAELPRADGAPRAGVLAKAVKPNQDRRIDLPTIGVDTVTGAAAAGLAGIVGEVGGLLVVDRAEVIRAADELGLFIVGIAPA